MGKHLLTKQQGVHLDENSPGCMWGIFHILDYHHWRHVKKMFPHGWNHGRRHARYARKKILRNCIDEALETEDDELEPLLVRQVSPIVTSPDESLRRYQDVSTAKDDTYRIGSSSVGGQLHLFCPKHCLEPSDYCVHCSSNHGNNTNPVNRRRICSRNTMKFNEDHQDVWNLVLHVDRDTKVLKDIGYQKLVEQNNHDEEMSNKLEEYRDLLGVLKVKKDMFIRILRDLDVNKKMPHSLQASNSNARLMKSGSYPVSRSSRSHKHTEIWVSPNCEQLNIASHADKALLSNNVQDKKVQPVLTVNDERDAACIRNRRTRKFFLGTSLGLNHQNWNQLVVHRFKIMKQKLKHALMEVKKGSSQNSAEQINQNSTECELTKAQESAQFVEDSSSQEDCKKSSSCENWDSNLSEQKASSFRIPCSLNDSLDRYTDLFERTFGKDKRWFASKSKSLKLINVDNDQISRSASKPCRRNLSLPDLDLLHFFLYEPSFDSHNSFMPAKISMDSSQKSQNQLVAARKSVETPTNSVKLSFHSDVPVDTIVETGHKNANLENCQSNIRYCSSSDLALIELEYNEGIAETSNDLRDDIRVEEEVTGSCREENKEIECITNPGTELIEPSQEALAFENEHHENCTIHKEDNGSMHSMLDSTYQRTHIEYIQTVSRCGEEDSLSPKFDFKNVSHFKCVEDILERSGITGDEHSGTWNIAKDQLNLSRLREVQALLANEYEFSGDNNIGYPHHQLLFDLLIEVLLDMQETLSTPFPRPLSPNCRVRPIPKGHRLLEEVWTGLNSYLRLRPELDPSLDDVVRRDMAKDSWMQLKLETECVIIELEDMIFQELCDEVVCA